MSIAYLDPGNIESDLQSGSIAQYRVRYSFYTILQFLIIGFIKKYSNNFFAFFFIVAFMGSPMGYHIRSSDAKTSRSIRSGERDSFS